MELSHIDTNGNAKMVDISNKPIIKRTAIAQGFISLSENTLSLLKDKKIPKGDVIATARIAGISGAKKTSDLIPLCHNVPIDSINVECTIEHSGISISSTVSCRASTGIEMEALTAVSITALTIYDMCKAVDKNMQINDIHLVSKHKETLEGNT